MEKLYLPLKQPTTARCGLRFLRSVMAVCSLLVCTLFYSSAVAQVTRTTKLLATENNSTQKKPFSPDKVIGNPYTYLESDDRTANSPNPDLPPDITCGTLRVIFVLDESGSIASDGNTNAVRIGAYKLANALLGSGAQLQVIEFSGAARVINLGGTLVDNTFMTNFKQYIRYNGTNTTNTNYSGQNYVPLSQDGCNSYTNWHDALVKVDAQVGDLVIFFTDGDPTAYNVSPNSGCYSNANNGSNGDGCTTNGVSIRYSTAGGTPTVALQKAVCMANTVKESGKHMFVVGIGSGVNVNRVKAISDNDNFATNPSIYTADYSIGNIDALAASLTGAVNGICGTELNITKTPSKGPFCINEFVTFTITVTNGPTSNGYTANNVVLTDVFPAASYSNVQIVTSPVPSGASVTGNTLTYNIGNLTNGQSKTIQVKAKITSVTTLQNTASAIADNANQVTANATPALNGTNPTITCPGNVTLELNKDCQVNLNNTGTATAISCLPPVTITSTDVTTPGCGNSYVITRTWKATDAVGHFSTCVQTISVVDNTPPTITAPANVTVACASMVPAVNVNGVTKSDNCPGTVVTHIGDVIEDQTCANRYKIKRKYRATDACGNYVEAIQTITVYDGVAPTITAPSNITVSCASEVPATNVAGVTTSDNCGGDVIVAWVSDVIEDQTCVNKYKIKRKYSATDVCGNVSYATQTITVKDETPPTASNPADVEISGCSTEFPAPDISVVTDAADNCGGSVTILHSKDDAPVSIDGCKKKIKRWYKVKDACNNFIYVYHYITIKIDNTPPTITAVANYTLAQCNQAFPETLNTQWTDNCSAGGPVIGYGGDVATNGCTQTRTYTFYVIDACGNDATASTTITRAYNEVLPVITPIANYALQGCNQDWPTLTTTWTSSCSGGGSVTGVAGDVATNGCTQTRTYTFSVTDACGNSSTASTIVTRTYDVTAPTITPVANYTLAECNQAWPETLNTQWSDNCSQGGGVIGYGADVATNGCTQTRTYTFSVTDACGNSSTASTIVTRTYDVTAPTIDAPASYVLSGCNPAWPVSVTANWSDNCSTGGVIEGVAGDVSTDACTQSRTYTFYVIDACGNSATASTTITRAYNEVLPIITPIADYALPGCNQDWPSLTTTWTSSCSGGGNVTGVAGDVITNGCTQTRTYTFTVNDDCGLGATVYTTVTRTYDVTAPTIINPANYTLAQCNQAWPNALTADCFDNCSESISILAYGGEVITNGCIQTRTYTFSFTDDCGNPATATTTVTRKYNVTAPTIDAPASYALTGCNAAWPVLSATWVDACGQSENVVNGVAGDVVTNGCSQSLTYTFSVIDDCGNPATAYTTVTRKYNVTAPTIDAPASYALAGCNGAWPVLSATWVDACGQSENVVNGVAGDVVTNGCSQSLTYTFSVIDACGNPATAYTTVTRKYNVTAPAIDAPASYALAGCNGAWPALSATWTDACSQSENVVNGVAGDVVTNGCLQSLTYTFSVIDNCGNPATAYTTVTRTYDVTDPTINAPADYVLEGCNPAWPSAVTATWSDNCNPNGGVIYGVAGDVSTDACTQSRTYTFYVIDACGNSATASTTITRAYNEVLPVITPIADYALQGCNQDWPTLTTTWTSSCSDGGNVTGVAGDVATNGCTQTRTYTFTVNDDCGLGATTYTTVTRYYNVTAPTIDAPASYALTGCNTAWPVHSATWVDACGQSENVVNGVAGDVVTNGCSQSLTYTYSVVDGCGNPATATTTVTRYYNVTAPTIDAPASYALTGCNTAWPVLSATWVDACGQSENVVNGVAGDVVTNGCSQSLTYTYSVVDACGNSATATTTVTRTYDVTAPTIYNPADYTLAECNQAWPETLYTQWSDNCSQGGGVIGYGADVATNGCTQTRTYTFSVVDACGNPATASTIVTRTYDVTAPTLVTPVADQFVQCGGEIVYQTPVFSDNCGLQSVVLVTPVDTTFLEHGYVIHRTFVATDNCGNTAEDSHDIFVVDDSVPVLINLPSDVYGQCGDIPEAAIVLGSDNCNEELEVEFEESVVEEGCYVHIERTWTVTDGDGNVTSHTQIIEFNDDTDPIIVSSPADVTIECGDPLPTDVPVFSDNCDDDLTIYPASSITLIECGYIIHRSWTATDNCGNTATATQNITIMDTQAPVLYGVPENVEAECGQLPAVADVTAIDACDGELEVTFSEDGEQDGCYYNLVRTWTATDACGRTATATQTIVVGDNTDPYIVSHPAEVIQVECSDDVPALVVEFGDNCDTELSTSAISGIGNVTECGHDIARSITATDDCGNSVTFAQLVQVRDTTDPYITFVPANLEIACTDAIPAVVPAEFADNCDTDLHVDYSTHNVDLDCGYKIVRTWTATDNCSNSISATQYITVTDNVPPVFDWYPVYVEFECSSEGTTIPQPTAHDNCGDVVITYVDADVSGGCIGNFIRTYTATDDCGHTATAVQTIAYIDSYGPVIENPANNTVQCDEAPTSIPDVNIYDTCTEVVSTTSNQEVVEIDDCTYKIIWHWTATDHCGNVSEATTTITVIDSQAPVFHNVPAGQTYSCNQEFEAPVAPTATDNCSEVTIVPSQVTVQDPNCPNAYDIHYTWTATDVCGNDKSVTVTYHVVDETAPVLSSTPENVTVECDAIPSVPEVTAYDICDGDVDVDFNEVISGTCDYTITRTWTAVDACGNDVVHTQVIHVQDTVDPVFTTEVENISVECAGDVPAPVTVTATDNCSEVTITPNVETLESDECGNAIIRVSYTAVDACGNDAVLEYYITVLDETAPELYGCPENLVLGCYDAAPEQADVTAYDNCQGEIEVDFEQFYFGNEPTEGSISDCRLLTPARPANNPCGYPVDWAMALFGLPNAHRYYQVDEGQFVRFPDGTVHVIADLVNAYDNTKGWSLDVWFANEKDWTAFSSQAFPTNFKADCGSIAANHTDWLYFVLQAGAGAELTGFGGYNGSALNLVHAPASKYFQFQLGDGANNYNAADNGFGGWFSYSGNLMVNNLPYGSNGNISGAGDFAFEMECCPDYYIIRQWTATDCTGNTSTCSQTITFDSSLVGGGDKVTIPSDEIADDTRMVVTVSPNPANSNTLFTFKTKENAKTTLEVFDAIGKKVADVFMGTVEAGVEYKVNYNVNALSTGVYLYRLQNGNSTEVGKLIIGK